MGIPWHGRCIGAESGGTRAKPGRPSGGNRRGAGLRSGSVHPESPVVNVGRRSPSFAVVGTAARRGRLSTGRCACHGSALPLIGRGIVLGGGPPPTPAPSARARTPGLDDPGIPAGIPSRTTAHSDDGRRGCGRPGNRGRRGSCGSALAARCDRGGASPMDPAPAAGWPPPSAASGSQTSRTADSSGNPPAVADSTGDRFAQSHEASDRVVIVGRESAETGASPLLRPLKKSPSRARERRCDARTRRTAEGVASVESATAARSASYGASHALRACRVRVEDRPEPIPHPTQLHAQGG